MFPSGIGRDLFGPAICLGGILGLDTGRFSEHVESKYNQLRLLLSVKFRFFLWFLWRVWVERRDQIGSMEMPTTTTMVTGVSITSFDVR